MRTARTSTEIETANEIALGKGSAIADGKGIEKGIGIAGDRAAVTEVGGKGNTEVGAETDRTEIEVEIVTVTKIVIGTGEARRTITRQNSLAKGRGNEESEDAIVYIDINVCTSV